MHAEQKLVFKKQDVLWRYMDHTNIPFHMLTAKHVLEL